MITYTNKAGIEAMTARLTLHEKRFETPTWQEPIKQDRNSGQLFRSYWSSSAHGQPKLKKKNITKAIQNSLKEKTILELLLNPFL